MKYSSEQLKILEDNTNYKQVIAAAGSGKTSTMIALLEKIIHEKKEKIKNVFEGRFLHHYL
jgi:DNA helicase-2/ATP-dependent DNA helicase PcrA